MKPNFENGSVGKKIGNLVRVTGFHKIVLNRKNVLIREREVRKQKNLVDRFYHSWWVATLPIGGNKDEK